MASGIIGGMLLALTREVSPAIVRCELTHLEREPIDLERARVQHLGYEAALAAAGCTLLRLVSEPELPDSVFVEDAAVVTSELGILARPGAESRRAEVESVGAALAAHRRCIAIQDPGTLDGGDVLRVGRTIYVGQSHRTNADGLRQMQAILEPLGYRVVGVPVSHCLHLKSAVTEVAEDTVLLNPAWVDPAVFAAHRRIEVGPAEPHAANGLRIRDALIFPVAFPRTRARLVAAGLRIVDVDVSELAKAEGAVTCCSLIITTPEN